MRNSGGEGTSRQQSISETGRMYAPPSLKGENLATVLDVAWHEQQRSAFQTLVAVLQAIVVTIGLGFAAVTLHYNGKTLDYNSKTLDESNRIAWRTFFDNKSTELGRDVLNRDALHCVYRYKLPRVDDDCANIVYDRKNLPHVLEYALQELWNLNEIKEDSEKEDKNYYNDWYADAARDFSDDPTGVVSFVLWEHLGCDHEEISTSDTNKNCNFAKRLGICITNERYGRDPQHCFDNLAARRNKFLQGVENHHRIVEIPE